MKSLRFTSILTSSLLASALAIGTLASAPSAAAQSTTLIARATIPFAFQTGSKVMPAGTYDISTVAGSMLLLRGQNASEFVLVQGEYASHAATRSSLIFDHYGDKYFLRQVWTAGKNESLECPKSHAEKQVQEALNKQAASSVAVAMNTTSHR